MTTLRSPSSRDGGHCPADRTVAAMGDEVRCLIGETLVDDTLAGMTRRILAQAPPRFALAGVSIGGFIAIPMAMIVGE